MAWSREGDSAGVGLSIKACILRTAHDVGTVSGEEECSEVGSEAGSDAEWTVVIISRMRSVKEVWSL